MPKVTKNIVDADLRNRVFNELNVDKFIKINDRQYGILLTDLNGVERYVRLGAIVAEERADMTARELMESEIADYREKQKKAAADKAKRDAKAEADKARREAKAAEKAAKAAQAE